MPAPGPQAGVKANTAGSPRAAWVTRPNHQMFLHLLLSASVEAGMIMNLFNIKRATKGFSWQSGS